MRLTALASATLLILAGCASVEPEAPNADIPAQAQSTAQPTQTEPNSEESAEADQGPENQAMAADEESAEPEVTATASSARGQEEIEESEPQESEISSAEPAETVSAEPTPSPTPTETAPEPEIVGYTLAEVAQRSTSADCWVAIDGGVYDLTPWIREHPGGAGAITQLCGTDGTQQFLGMHGGQSRPASTLEGFYIGPLR